MRRIEPGLVPLVASAGSHLTPLQLAYLQERMQPCPAELVSSAAYTVSWRDSDGVANVAHCGPLGAVVPVVAREATLALWRALGSNGGVVRAAGALSDEARAVMAATTTDKDPVEILRIGVDTTARALVQHAYLADDTPYRSAAEFACGLRDSGIFSVVANTWFWGLQSSTFRRGMIPVRLKAQDDGTVRYTAETASALRAMKDRAIAEAVEKQYALLPVGEQPRCLANMAVDGTRLVPGVVDVFVETFVQLLELVEIADATVEEVTVAADEAFEVPDMTCSHCTNTITGVLEGLGVQVTGIDLETKRVIAAFPTAEIREQSFEAIRGRGYTVVPRSA
jgi:copper chaperone CopZ